MIYLLQYWKYSLPNVLNIIPAFSFVKIGAITYELFNWNGYVKVLLCIVMSGNDWRTHKRIGDQFFFTEDGSVSKSWFPQELGRIMTCTNSNIVLLFSLVLPHFKALIAKSAVCSAKSIITTKNAKCCTHSIRPAGTTRDIALEIMHFNARHLKAPITLVGFNKG